MNIEMLQTEINTIKNSIADLKANDSRKAVIGINRFDFEIIIFIGNAYVVSTPTSLYSTLDKNFIQDIIDDLEECTVKTNFKRLMKSVIEREENRIKELERQVTQ